MTTVISPQRVKLLLLVFGLVAGLSFFIALFSGLALGWALLKAITSGLVFTVVASVLLLVLKKFIPNLFEHKPESPVGSVINIELPAEEVQLASKKDEDKHGHE